MEIQSMSTDQLLTPAEVAAILFVDPKTVTRWARAGKIDAIRTPGGHRRYLRSDVQAIMSGRHSSQKPDGQPAAPSVPEIAAQRTAQDSADADTDRDGVDSEAVLVALEAEAAEAAEAVLVSAAALSAAAERASRAAARARDARAATTARVPTQRSF